MSGISLLNYYLQHSPEHPQSFYLQAISKFTVCLSPQLNHTNSQLITCEHSNLLYVFLKKPVHVQACTWVNFCSCYKIAAPCRIGAPAKAWKNSLHVCCPLCCFPPHQATTNACHSWFATSPVAPTPGFSWPETGAEKRNTCLSLNWTEKKEEENDKIIACSTLFMRTSFQWYMSAPGESIVSPLTYFKCQGCHARRQWWTSLNRIWYYSHVQSVTLWRFALEVLSKMFPNSYSPLQNLSYTEFKLNENISVADKLMGLYIKWCIFSCRFFRPFHMSSLPYYLNFS